MANAAWLALTVMAHNLGRAVGHLAGSELQRRPRRRCAARSSPCQAGSSTPDDDVTYDCRRPGLGRAGRARTDTDHRDPAALLNLTAAPTTGTSDKPADRRRIPA
jgi:hypothetical protein